MLNTLKWSQDYCKPIKSKINVQFTLSHKRPSLHLKIDDQQIKTSREQVRLDIWPKNNMSEMHRTYIRDRMYILKRLAGSKWVSSLSVLNSTSNILHAIYKKHSPLLYGCVTLIGKDPRSREPDAVVEHSNSCTTSSNKQQPD